jgi:hypothetical protein
LTFKQLLGLGLGLGLWLDVKLICCDENVLGCVIGYRVVLLAAFCLERILYPGGGLLRKSSVWGEKNSILQQTRAQEQPEKSDTAPIWDPHDDVSVWTAVKLTSCSP